MTEATERLRDMEANYPEISAGTEHILAKVFFLIMCLHSACHTEDTHLHLVLDILLSSVEENCCRVFKNGFFYSLRLDIQHWFPIPNLAACLLGQKVAISSCREMNYKEFQFYGLL